MRWKTGAKRSGNSRRAGGDLVESLDGNGGQNCLPFYFVFVFISFFPWSIKLPALVKRLWRGRDAIDNYLICAVAIVFIIMTLVKTKLPHYTLPAFPLLSLLLARHLFELSSPRFAIRTAQAAAACSLAAALFAFPLFSRTFPTMQLFKQSEPDLVPEMEMGTVDYFEPSVIWYFRSRVHGFFRGLNPDQVQQFMENPGARFVIVPTEVARAAYTEIPREWKTYHARGFTLVKGRPTDLTMILKPRLEAFF